MKAVILFSIIFQNPLFVNDNFKESSLFEYMTVYRDTVPHTLDEIIEIYEKGLFVTPPNESLTFSSGPYYYFLHYSVKNTSAHSITLYNELRNSHLNQVQLYYSDSISYQKSILTGDYYPFDQREINHRFFVFETELESGEQKDFFIFTDKYNQSISTPVIIHSKNNFIEKSILEASVSGYYFGAILSILIAAIIISIISPRKLNFLFIFYLLGFSLCTYSQMGFGYQYLWGAYPFFNSLSLTFFAMISIFIILVFAYYFFEMKEEKKWLKRLHWAVTIIITLNWGLQLIYYILVYQHSAQQYWFNYRILQLAVFIFPSYFLFLVIYQIVRKNYLKYYFFLLSTIGMLGAVAIIMLGQIALLSGMLLLEYLVLIAMIVDFTTLGGILSVDLFTIKIKNKILITSLDQAIADGAKNFLEGQQIERSRLAQEIHDGTGIHLSSIQMKLSSIETEDNTKRDNILNDLSIVSRDLRKFSHNLSSVVLEQYGLINAIEELIISLEDIYPDFTYEFDYDPIIKMDQLKEKELYFIISELINNTIKHSKGNRINLHFKTIESSLVIEYMDNGIGFVSEKKTKGLGLKSIEWRLNILSGEMDYIQENGFNKCRFQIPI